MNRTFNNLKNKDSSNLNLFGIALLVILFSSSSYGVLPDFTELVEKAAPAVVKINTISVQKNSDEGSFPCLLYTSPSPRDQSGSRMTSSA